ncbi:hypothetical protein K1719_026714 [Acacia pycnantha]|nr:hypothetical protein K1719_026714 [Acacia pycnantha]
MEIYPVAPCTEEEFNEWCESWNYALIITVLGKKFNLFVLKELLVKLWGFSSFELIDIPNNCFVVRFQDQELWRTHYRKEPATEKSDLRETQRYSSGFNLKKVPTATDREVSRFPVLDVSDGEAYLQRDVDLVWNDDRQPELRLGKSPSVKRTVQASKKDLGGKSKSQRLQYKPKIHTKPNENKPTNGPAKQIEVVGPSNPSDFCQIGQNDLQIIPKDGAYLTNDISKDLAIPDNAAGPTSLHAGQFINLQSEQPIQIPDENHPTNHAMVSHMGSKKSNEKRSKSKSQRGHIVVQGNLNNMT